MDINISCQTEFPTRRRRRFTILSLVLALPCVLSTTGSHAADLRDAQPANAAAPDCPLKLADAGGPSSIAQFRGKVLYVDFWASWCPPCLKSFPFMNELQNTFRDQGLQVLAVNLDEKPDDAAKFLAEHPAGFNVAVSDNASCAKDFNVQVMPSSYLVDRAGTIRHMHLGFHAGDPEKLRAMVEQLLAEPPVKP